MTHEIANIKMVNCTLCFAFVLIASIPRPKQTKDSRIVTSPFEETNKLSSAANYKKRYIIKGLNSPWFW